MTVNEVAEHCGVSDGFMVRALDQIGFKDAKPDIALPTPAITRFESVWGERIRAKRRTRLLLSRLCQTLRPPLCVQSTGRPRTSFGSLTRRSLPVATPSERGTAVRGVVKSCPAPSTSSAGR